MADAMDWHPTTPPTAHNPYSIPNYMPGGWPVSPPKFRYTSGVFARKRASTCLGRAAKRVCTGMKTIGSVALFPVKPVYLIVRHLRSRRHREQRSSSSGLAQSRQHRSPAQQPQLQAAEGHLASSRTNAPSPQIFTSLSALPTTHSDLNTPALAGRNPSDYYSPAPTSVTNTETTIQSPAADSVTNTENAVQSPLVDRRTKKLRMSARVGIGLKRGKEQASSAPSASQKYSTLDSYLVDQQTREASTLEPDMAPSARRMTRPNRFDADYKWDPTAYAARHASPGMKTKPIGVKIEGSEPESAVFGGWTFEKPIEIVTPPLVCQSEQTEPDLEIPDSNTENDVPEKSPPRSFEHREPPPSPPPTSETYDETWDSCKLLEQFLPNDYFETEEESKAGPLPYPGELIRALEAPIPLPPPIKERPFTLAVQKVALRSKLARKDSTDDHVETPKTVGQAETSLKSEGKDDATLTDIKAHQHSEAAPICDNNNNVKTEHLDITGDMKLAPKPETPLKAVAVKPAVPEPETPAAQLAKLQVGDAGDNSTPKATPHSGTKTVRLTRYQRAQEEARKAKLEQYELISVSGEWDRKVRDAVRNGIPDFLGPRDLARVVPQYAGRGQDNWLNDETINKYLEIVAAHGRKNDRPGQVVSHHAFNNFFYNNLKAKGAESVVRWAKRAKIGGRNLMYVEKVFVPINSGAHWTLAVVEPTQKRITHYNSMRGAATGIRACEDLKSWVAVELGKDFKEEEWTLATAGESPQQTNSDDCGVFTITSARQIMLGFTPMSYGPAQIPNQRIRIVAELINQGLLRSTQETMH